MNWIDWTLLLTVAISVLSGFCQGFSRTGLGLIAVIAGFLAAAWLYPADALPFCLAFAGIVAAGWILSRLLSRWFRSLDLAWLDKPLGAALGLANGVLVWAIMVLVLMSLGSTVPRDQLARSEFVPYAMDAAWTLAEAVPPEMKDGVRRHCGELEKYVPPRYRKDLPEVRPGEI